jgi:hypothetical protein
MAASATRTCSSGQRASSPNTRGMSLRTQSAKGPRLPRAVAASAARSRYCATGSAMGASTGAGTSAGTGAQSVVASALSRPASACGSTVSHGPDPRAPAPGRAGKPARARSRRCHRGASLACVQQPVRQRAASTLFNSTSTGADAAPCSGTQRSRPRPLRGPAMAGLFSRRPRQPRHARSCPAPCGSGTSSPSQNAPSRLMRTGSPS